MSLATDISDYTAAAESIRNFFKGPSTSIVASDIPTLNRLISQDYNKGDNTGISLSSVKYTTWQAISDSSPIPASSLLTRTEYRTTGSGAREKRFVYRTVTS